MNERDVARLLAAREQGTCEVPAPVGFIDVLTARVVYEVKEVSLWKVALGQVLAYACSYPEHTPALYLFGPVSPTQRMLITAYCTALMVRVVGHRAPKLEDATTLTPQPKEHLPDGWSLVLSVSDTSSHIRSTNTLQLTVPDHARDQATLQAYLLDQELRLTLRYARARPPPSQWQCARPRMLTSAWPATCASASSAGRICRSVCPPSSGCSHRARLGRSDAARPIRIPELTTLFQLILHPDYRWMNTLGHRAVAITQVPW